MSITAIPQRVVDVAGLSLGDGTRKAILQFTFSRIAGEVSVVNQTIGLIEKEGIDPSEAQGLGPEGLR